jgi:protein TonB
LAGCATAPATPELTAADLFTADAAGQPAELDLSTYYPDVAMRKEVTGRAVVRCDISQDRTLQNCRIVEESPPGLRFGDATIRVAARMRVKPEVAVTFGQTALVRINWTLPR